MDAPGHSPTSTITPQQVDDVQRPELLEIHVPERQASLSAADGSVMDETTSAGPSSPVLPRPPSPRPARIGSSMRGRVERRNEIYRPASYPGPIGAQRRVASPTPISRRRTEPPIIDLVPDAPSANNNTNANADAEPQSLYMRVRTFLGHGNPSRRRRVNTLFSLALFLSQTVICCVFIALTHTTWRSQDPDSRGEKSEWDACSKPLGSMMIVWLVRCVAGIVLTVWSFKRSLNIERRDAEERAARARERRERRALRRAQLSVDQAATTAAQPSGAALTTPATPAAPPQPNANGETNANANPPRVLTGWDKVYDRSVSVISLLALAHFCVTNVLIFSSTKSCRVSSPHLWWSTFAMLCLTYVIILEVFVIGFTIFVVMPIIFIVLNILLIMTGHRPISARQIIDPGHINPETPKMSQKLVDKIPLVLYIPAPELPSAKASPATVSIERKGTISGTIREEENAGVGVEGVEGDVGRPEIESTPVPEQSPVGTEIAEVDGATPSDSPHTTYPPPPTPTLPPPPVAVVLAPEQEHEQPIASTSAAAPASPSKPSEIPSSSTVPRPNPRFRFFRRKRRRDTKASELQASPNSGVAAGAEAEAEEDGDEEDILASWDDQYEKSSLPFVRLENNRAACAICLMDFDEPPKRRAKAKSKTKTKGKPAAKGEGEISEEMVTPTATEPPEPLRLLECGHVFHKSCLDPWLTGVSGRCPTCQRKVEILPKGKRASTTNANADSLV